MAEKLVAIVDDIEQIDESLRGFYTARDDGKHILTVEGNLPGLVEKSRLDEFRDRNISQAEENKKLQAQLSAFDGVDVDKYKEWQQREDDIERKDLLEAGQVTELVSREVVKATNPLQEQIKSLEQVNKQLQEDRDRQLLDEEIYKAANQYSARPGTESFLLLQAKQEGWKTTDGKAVQVDASGSPVFSDKSAGAHKSIPEWMEEKSQQYGWAFAPSAGGGATGSVQKESPTGVKQLLDRDDKRGFQDNLEEIAKGDRRLKEV